MSYETMPYHNTHKYLLFKIAILKLFNLVENAPQYFFFYLGALLLVKEHLITTNMFDLDLKIKDLISL